MTTVFSVVGQHEEDADLLLLLGEDGQHYQYDVVNETTAPVEPAQGWIVDPNAPTLDDVMS